MKKRLSELAFLFMKLGFTAFGGPAAHIAIMEDEVVRRRRWMDGQHFLDLVGAVNLIPGPNSTEMAIYCGRVHAGTAGLFVAGLSFILPACLLTSLLAFGYKEYGALPQVEPFLYGIKPAVLMILLGAVLSLGRKAAKNTRMAVFGGAAVVCSLAGAGAVAVILATGAAGVLWNECRRRFSGRALSLEPVSLWLLFAVFLKIGAVLFGSGYVLVAYLETELIEKLGWITREQLLDAVAIGQFTPGPVLSTATFIGWQIAGLPGAVAATVGIFLPSFLLVWALHPLVPAMRRSPRLAAFLDAVNAAAVGVMAAVALLLGRQVLTGWRAVVIALAAAAAVFGPKKPGSVWVIAGGAALGRLLFLF